MSSPNRPRQTGGRPPRREPLFPLDEDLPSPERRAPPAPLADLFEDIDTALPTRAAPRRPPARPRQAPEAAPDGGQRRPGAARPAPGPGDPGGSIPRQPARPRGAADELASDLTRLSRARLEYDEAGIDLARAEMLTARPYSRPHPGRQRRPDPATGLPAPLLAAVAVISLLILFTLTGGGATITSGWAPLFGGDATTERAQLFGGARPPGDYVLKAPPSLSPQQIDAILASFNSPATGTGQIWYNLGLEYGIDPAFAVAFFIHESSAGSNPNWAGIKPDGSTTHNVGNIICAGYRSCYNRFRDYSSWEEGIADWYRLIDVEYIQGRGTLTVAEIIPIYAPAFENDVQGYINSVNAMVDGWRSQGTP